MTARVRNFDPRQDLEDVSHPTSVGMDALVQEPPKFATSAMEGRDVSCKFPRSLGQKQLGEEVDPSTQDPLTEGRAHFPDVAARTINPFPRVRKRERFSALQKWEGFVLEVGADSFIARLVDRSHTEPDEEVEIPVSDVPSDDRDLLVKGGVFYWSIGYINDLSGGLKRASEIRFRRLPMYRPAELAEAREEALRRRIALGWDE